MMKAWTFTCNICNFEKEFDTEAEAEAFSCLCQNKPQEYNIYFICDADPTHRYYTNKANLKCKMCQEKILLGKMAQILPKPDPPQASWVNSLDERLDELAKLKIQALQAQVEVPNLIKNLESKIDKILGDKQNV